MERLISHSQVQEIESEIRSFEDKTGCELLVVVTDSCDDYPAASLRFGLFSSFGLVLLFSYFFQFEHAFLWPICFFVLTILMTWLGQMDWAKRMGLSEVEVNRESDEKAIELFHTLGTSQVIHKVTAMILVSQLEKRIEVLVDEQLKSKMTQEELNELVFLMRDHFQRGDILHGFVMSIRSFADKIINDFGGKVSENTPDQLKNTIIFIEQERHDRPL